MKLADYSQQVTAPQLDFGLRAGGFEGVFHYLAGTPGFALRIETPEVVKGIRERGWPQLGIDIPRLPANVDGAAVATRAAQLYGFGAGLRIYLDIEPAQYRIDPGSWPGAADRWCDAVRAAGFSPGVYGVDDTLASCANHADSIWRAKPGQCDPAGPGLADAFYAGRRAVQCSSGTWGGIEFDVNFSQFSTVGGDPVAVSFPARDEAEGFVDAVLFGGLLDQLAPTAADREYWVALALAQGLWAAADQFLMHPDVAAHRALRVQLLADYTAGKLGGSVVVPAPDDDSAFVTHAQLRAALVAAAGQV